MPLIDGLPDYERMMSRSLALWRNALQEIAAEPDTPVEAAKRIEDILWHQVYLESVLPEDPGILREEGVWKELESELDFLHKRIIHALPDREFAHRKIRVIEELIANLKLTALSRSPDRKP